MQLSQLNLKGYIITNLSVKAEVPKSLDEAAKAISGSMANLSTNVELAKSGENQRLWKVALRIACHPSDNTQFYPYTIDIELLGFFEVASDVDETRIQDLVSANAPAVLFGAARELVLLITGRGPLPPVTLPCTTFADVCQSNQKKTDDKPLLAHAGKTR